MENNTLPNQIVNKPSVIQLVLIKILIAISSCIKSDALYLKLYFFLYTGKWIDFNNVRTFSEKIQWLKMHNTNPSYTEMVDKYLFKQYVESRIGRGYTVPILGAWDRWPSSKDLELLPDRFVLKTNHDSGGVWVIKNKKAADFDTIRIAAEKRLKKNYFYAGREYPYKNVHHKIIAEQFMEEAAGSDLKDYKIFCFNGEPHFIQVDLDRFKNHKRDFYDTNWRMMDFGILFPRSYKIIERPENLSEMVEIARKLSAGIPFLRVDLYNINGKVLVGELTFHPGGGVEKITPIDWDMKLGNMIKL